VAELIAIGYDDQTTAGEALAQVETLSRDLIIEADAAAAIVRKPDGKYSVTTNHGPTTGAGATWGMFWGLLFGMLFFIPVFGMAVGAGLGALFAHLEKSTIDKQFQEQVRAMLKPGTSALFMVIEKATPDKAIAGLRQYGGTVLKTSLSEDDTARLQAALHGEPVAV
jgi:uncharacterized membrane protein